MERAVLGGTLRMVNVLISALDAMEKVCGQQLLGPGFGL